jgi:hypothetical protein
VDLGKGPEFLWWSDFESASFSDWTSDQNGYLWIDSGGSLDFVGTPTRSGQHSARATVTTSSVDQPSSALLARKSLPTEAFYSAWFYIPSAVVPTEYWLIFKFRSRSNATVSTTDVDLWDLDLMSDGTSGMRARLYHHGDGDMQALASTSVPISRWFQVEAFFRAASNDTGQLTVWLDGVLLFNVTGRATVPSSYVEWAIGGATGALSPSSATIFTDDAAITTQRLGPDFPPFWQGR